MKSFVLMLCAILLVGCTSVTQRHDFVSYSDSSGRICGEARSLQNAILLQSPKTNFVIQAKSIGGLYLTGFFFAPIFPWEPLNSKANIVRLYSPLAFSPDEKDNVKNWEIESENTIFKASEVKFNEEVGSIGNFNYSHIAEVSFRRPRWGLDFTLLVKSSDITKRIQFFRKSKWNYQWMGNEVSDPKCISD